MHIVNICHVKYFDCVRLIYNFNVSGSFGAITITPLWQLKLLSMLPHRIALSISLSDRLTNNERNKKIPVNCTSVTSPARFYRNIFKKIFFLVVNNANNRITNCQVKILYSVKRKRAHARTHSHKYVYPSKIRF